LESLNFWGDYIICSTEMTQLPRDKSAL